MDDRPGKKMFIGLKPTSVPNQELVNVFQVLMDNDDGMREGFPVFEISNLLEDPSSRRMGARVRICQREEH